MEKRILEYRKRIDELLKKDDANWPKIMEEHLTQISFFQHERLVHLIVTITFALLEMLSLLGMMILESLAKDIIAFATLTIFFLALLIPYIRHYYILENEIQKVYKQYDEILYKVNI